MVVSDFDAFIHGCTVRCMQNFVNIDPAAKHKNLSHVWIPVRAILEYGIVSSHGVIGSVSEARVTDVVLHLIRAQGRLVRQEARTRSCCQL